MLGAPVKAGRAAARRVLLRKLLSGREIPSQDKLVRLLGRHGHRVTQTTVSRDLAAIHAEKVPEPGGALGYRVRGRRSSPDLEELAHILREFVTAIDASRNLVVLKTPPGAASPVAAAIDRSAPEGVLGTLAGDDTLLVITRSETGGPMMARRLSKLLEV